MKGLKILLSLLLVFQLSADFLPEGYDKMVIYYNDFEQENGKARLNFFDITEKLDKTNLTSGLLGKGYLAEGIPMFGGGGFSLHSPSLSPHKSLTICLWWALKEDHKPGQGFVIFSLTGKGFISNFVRGGGEDTWCALTKPAGVFQVYYLPGILNINGIYDFDIMRSLDLRKGIWHNTVVTFSCGREITLYQDGKRVGRWVLSRELKEDDGINTLYIGSGESMYFDEVLIIRGVMREEDIERYNSCIKGLREIFSF